MKCTNHINHDDIGSTAAILGQKKPCLATHKLFKLTLCVGEGGKWTHFGSKVFYGAMTRGHVNNKILNEMGNCKSDKSQSPYISATTFLDQGGAQRSS